MLPQPSRPLVEHPFTLDVERHGPATLIRLSGSCTMNQSARLGECMVSVANEGVRLIVLDMGKLDFIESTGLGAIVAGYLRVRHNQGEVRIVSPPPSIRHLLDVTRLTQLFPVAENVDQALRSG